MPDNTFKIQTLREQKRNRGKLIFYIVFLNHSTYIFNQNLGLSKEREYFTLTSRALNILSDEAFYEQPSSGYESFYSIISAVF